MHQSNALAVEANDRRASKREALVLRIGVISSADKTCFCLIKNVSSTGMLVKLFARASEGAITVRVADEEPIAGRIAWTRDQLAGIEFNEELADDALLRVKQKLAPNRRRSSPRVSTRARVILRSGGRFLSATLLDVSPLGARVQLAKAADLASSAMITLPDMPSMRAFVRWQDEQEIGLAFEIPVPIEVIARWVNDRVGVTP